MIIDVVLVLSVNLWLGHSMSSMGMSAAGNVSPILKTLLQMALLYIGPIYNCVRSGEIPDQSSFWIMIRSIFAAPVVEEILFRGVILSRLLQHYSNVQSTLCALLLFSIPHCHHLYHEIPEYGVAVALRDALFRCGYTSVFGALSCYLFIAHSSLLSPIVAHVWCNFFGSLFIPSGRSKKEFGFYVIGLGSFIIATAIL